MRSMADDQDQSSKTEEPTDRKLNKLREDGTVPRSREVNHLFMLLAMLLAVIGPVPWMMDDLMNLFGSFLQEAATTGFSHDKTTIGAAMRFLTEYVLYAMIPFFGWVTVLLGWIIVRQLPEQAKRQLGKAARHAADGGLVYVW